MWLSSVHLPLLSPLQLHHQHRVPTWWLPATGSEHNQHKHETPLNKPASTSQHCELQTRTLTPTKCIIHLHMGKIFVVSFAKSLCIYVYGPSCPLFLFITWLAHSENLKWFYSVQCCYDNCDVLWIVSTSVLTRSGLMSGYIPWPRFAMYLFLPNFSTILTALLATSSCEGRRGRI